MSIKSSRMLAVVLIGTLVTVSAAENSFHSSDKDFAKGVELVSRGKQNEAAALFKERIENAPDDVDANLAYISIMTNMYREKEARKEYESRLYANPKSGLPYLFLAFTSNSQKEFKVWIEKGLDADPGNSSLRAIQATIDAGQLLVDNRKEDVLSRTASIPQTRIAAHLHLVRSGALQASGRWDEAVKETKLAAAKLPFDPTPHIVLAILHSERAEFARALEEVEKARALQDSANARLLKTTLLMMLGKLKRAQAAYESILAVPAQSPEDLAAWGAANWSLGRRAEAWRNVYDAQTRSDDLSITAFLILMESRIFGMAHARHSIDKLLEKHPRFPPLLGASAQMHFSECDCEKALKELNEILTRNPKSVEHRILRGQTHYAMGLSTEAIGDLKAAQTIAPKYYAVYSALSLVHLGMKEYGLSRRNSERALELFPDSAGDLIALGSIELASGTTQQAEAYFERAKTLAFGDDKKDIDAAIEASKRKYTRLPEAPPLLEPEAPKNEAYQRLLGGVSVVAARRGKDRIGPEDFLLAISSSPDTHGFKVLKRLRVDPRKLAKRIDAAYVIVPSTNPFWGTPYTREAGNVISDAFRFSYESGKTASGLNDTTTAHLLMAVVANASDPLKRILTEDRISTTTVRNAVLSFYASKPSSE